MDVSNSKSALHTADESRHLGGYGSNVYSSVVPLPSDRDGPRSINKTDALAHHDVGVLGKMLHGICRWSWLPSILFCFFATVMAMTALRADRWSSIKIDYTVENAVGRSETVLGALHMRRTDYITADDAMLLLTRTLAYKFISDSTYCAANAKPDLKAVLPSDESGLRRMDQVGLLDAEKEAAFVAQNGRVIYDVLCSAISEISYAGYLILIMFPISAILFLPLITICISRTIFNKVSHPGDTYRIVEIVAFFTWLVSILLSTIALLCYWLAVRKPLCVNAAGEMIGCTISASMYLVLLYTIFSALCLSFYLLYGRSLRKGVSHNPVRLAWPFHSRRRNTST